MELSFRSSIFRISYRSNAVLSIVIKHEKIQTTLSSDEIHKLKIFQKFNCIFWINLELVPASSIIQWLDGSVEINEKGFDPVHNWLRSSDIEQWTSLNGIHWILEHMGTWTVYTQSYQAVEPCLKTFYSLYFTHSKQRWKLVK